jgi:hypothetical protein
MHLLPAPGKPLDDKLRRLLALELSLNLLGACCAGVPKLIGPFRSLRQTPLEQCGHLPRCIAGSRDIDELDGAALYRLHALAIVPFEVVIERADPP